MARRRSLQLAVVPTPGRDYQGKPYRHCTYQWVDAEGSKTTGQASLNSLIGRGLGMVAKVGDIIRVTIEINPEGG